MKLRRVHLVNVGLALMFSSCQTTEVLICPLLEVRIGEVVDTIPYPGYEETEACVEWIKLRDGK